MEFGLIERMVKPVLHIGSVDKFTAPFFALLVKHIDITNHRMLSRVGNTAWPDECEANLVRRRGLYWLFCFISMAYKAEKIVIHGLFDIRVIFLLFIQPWLLNKCYWVIWGGDLYKDELDALTIRWKITEYLRRPVIKNMGNLVTYVRGDVDLARQLYGAKGNHFECLMYPSNVITPINLPHVLHTTTTFLIGHSACTNNNHMDAFQRLVKLKDQNFKLICPLSYGAAGYAEKVAAEGNRLFGERFIPLTEFMPFKEYLTLLNSIDIAVFNHERQQAMGNTIALLGLGKKVYMRRGTTSWNLINSLGIKVFDIDDLSLELIDNDVAVSNQEIVKNYFSTKNLVIQLKAIFV